MRNTFVIVNAQGRTYAGFDPFKGEPRFRRDYELDLHLRFILFKTWKTAFKVVQMLHDRGYWGLTIKTL